MAIFYSLYIRNPNFDPKSNKITVSNWPPQILESDWFKNITKQWFKLEDNKHSQAATSFLSAQAARIIQFENKTDFETWFNTNRLTDPVLLAILKEWHSAYNITMSEHWIELPNYDPTIPGLFG